LAASFVHLQMHLTLSRVEPSDFDAILPVLFEAFGHVELSTVFFGKSSPKNLAIRKKKILDTLRKDPADVWLKTTDEDEEVDVDIINEDYVEQQGNDDRYSTSVKGRKRVKRIVGAGNWKVYPTFVEPKEVEEAAEAQGAAAKGEFNGTTEGKKANGSDLIWLSTPAEKADAHIILEDFLNRRRRACREGHILLYILFVDPAYQRKGAGAMMVEWGCELADQMMLPAWVEASPYGHGLYAKYGYEDVEEVRIATKSFVGEYTHMRRPVRVKGFKGRELVKFA
jgi:GNAT superfamily N-acetyltransferase